MRIEVSRQPQQEQRSACMSCGIVVSFGTFAAVEGRAAAAGVADDEDGEGLGGEVVEG
jgi:hypothetical protein